MPETMTSPDQTPALPSAPAPAGSPAPVADFDEWLADLLGDLVDRSPSSA